jgi:hypothetical protein
LDRWHDGLLGRVEPGLEEVVELLAGDVLGDPDELLGRAVAAGAAPAQRWMIAQKLSSPTAWRSASSVIPADVDGVIAQLIDPGIADLDRPERIIGGTPASVPS